jgi:trigger factor
MNYEVKELPKGQVEITFEVPVDAFQNDLRAAATRLSEAKPIAGFRPGKATYETVVNKYGEMALYNEALPDIVRRAYVTAVRDKNLKAYGQPEIKVKQVVPGSPITFSAKVAVLPEVVLADIRKIKVKANEVTVPDADVEKALGELQRMQTKEIKVERELGPKDKAIVDLDMSKDGVPTEGGQARGHGVYMDEEHYIPGLKEKLLGQKAGETREFTLTFPAEHFQKNLAGQDIDFKVTLSEVYELQNPELNDEFAASLGKKDLADLRHALTDNMKVEEEERERERRELEALEQIVEKSKFGDVPEQIINDEVERMIEELEHSVSHRGLKMDDYLASIRKTMAELKLDFVSQAIKRIKTSIAIKAIADQEKVEVSDDEVAAEIEKIMNQYTGNATAQEQVKSEEFEDYTRIRLRNRATVELIRELTTK